MAIYIILAIPRNLSSLEIISDRLRACYESIKFFNNKLFYLSEVEIWFDATSEALGGILSRVIPITNLLDDVNKVYDYVENLRITERLRTIIVFRGHWEIADIKLAGYFSVNNKFEWNSVYGDIEISAYSKGNISDIIDALWSLDERDAIISKFIHDFYDSIQTLRVRLSLIVFCFGVWSKDDLSNVMAFYLAGGRRNLLSVFYSALKESKVSEIIMKSKPLNTKFLLDTLKESKIVDDRISERLVKNVVAELPAKSSIYIAKERDSFGKLFKDISKAILIPAFSELPREEDVKKNIEKGLKEYSEEKRV
jgi:hypothetical protein